MTRLRRAWPDIATRLAHDAPRVLAWKPVRDGRPGGTHDHHGLAAPHERTGERILGVVVPSLSDGPHTRVARAYAGPVGAEASRP